jgi:hypothetical protein
VTAPGSGIGGAPLRVLSCGDLAALVSTSDAATRTAENAMLHDRALTAVVRAGATVAAVRFGQLFESDEACCRDVASHTDRIASLLREADDCVEMRVVLRVQGSSQVSAATPPSQPSDETGPGRAYLESLRQSAPAVPNVSIRAAIGPMIRGEKVEALDQAGGVTIVHLIRRGDEVRYRVAVATLSGLSDARVLGPFPLYSFAEPGV